MLITPDLLRAAERLGLTEQDGAARGTLDGQRVSLAFELQGSQGANAVVRGWLDPPLDLGLDLRRRIVAGLVEPSPVSGNAELDGEFAIDGDEPARVSELFDAALGEHLVALHRASFEIRLHDAGCSIFGLYGLFDVDQSWVDRALHAAAATAALMHAARWRVPAATRLAPHAAALRAYAGARGLTCGSAPLLLSGSVEGRSLQAGATRTGHRRYHLHARAELDGDLDVGLQIRRQGLLDGLATMFGGQDILVGDAPFDARFLIHARPDRADRVAALLDADTRASLLAIDARAGAVVLDDRGVTVDPIDVGHDPAELTWLLDALVEVSGQISKNLVRGGGDDGPYR